MTAQQQRSCVFVIYCEALDVEYSSCSSSLSFQASIYHILSPLPKLSSALLEASALMALHHNNGIVLKVAEIKLQ